MDGQGEVLARGNHVLEATLHALYELIERDAAAGLLQQLDIGDAGVVIPGAGVERGEVEGGLDLEAALGDCAPDPFRDLQREAAPGRAGFTFRQIPVLPSLQFRQRPSKNSQLKTGMLS